MSKIGEQFSEFRKTTPRYVQWILLAAAIVIVVVLLMMLIGNRKAQRVIIDPESLPPTPELIITPDAPVDWSDTVVGEVREAEFFISANTRVQVTNVVVRVEGDTNDAVGISATETCKNDQTIIEQNVPCIINIKFQPEHPINTTDANVAITWSAFETGAVRDMHSGKGRMDLLPWAAIIEVSKHCENGAVKYGEHNVDLTYSL